MKGRIHKNRTNVAQRREDSLNGSSEILRMG
jgi:hypothetical protein